MEHKLLFTHADDRSNPDPSKDYGVQDIEMKFVVIGNKGVVEFQLSTNWYLPHVMDRRLECIKRDVYRMKKDFLLMTWISPKPLDVCYYSLEQLTEDDTYFDVGLSYVFDHKPCFYGYRYTEEVNGMWTTDFVYDLLLTQGDGAVWDYLEKYYIDTFGKDNE